MTKKTHTTGRNTIKASAKQSKLKQMLPTKQTAKAANLAVPQQALSSRSGGTSKHNHILDLLKHPKGTTLATLMTATGWQAHSVRGFLAGTVKKKLGMKLTSEKIDGVRIYRIEGVTP